MNNTALGKPKWPGTSLITCSMNRSENLKRALKTWLRVDGLNEIVIVDWSSSNPVENVLPTETNGKTIKLIKAENQKRWILSHAFNLAASFVGYNKMIKIDADVMLYPDFLKSHRLTKKSFYRGWWANARNKNEVHLNGQLYCYVRDFWSVNGYHEGIESYGWDDDDLYRRLTGKRKLNVRYLDINKMRHIETEDAKRVESQPELALALETGQELPIGISVPDSDENIVLFESTMKNKAWCKKNPWKPTDKLRKWDVEKINENTYVCRS